MVRRGGVILSQKCQYALRAVFELMRSPGVGPIKIGRIAAAQAIPIPFLQTILNQLKQAGIIVETVRGKDGGYRLARDGRKLTVGEVILSIQGPIVLVDCHASSIANQCPFAKDCVFWPLWEKARHALLDVLNATTFDDLVKLDEGRKSGKILTYSI